MSFEWCQKQLSHKTHLIFEAKPSSFQGRNVNSRGDDKRENDNKPERRTETNENSNKHKFSSLLDNSAVFVFASSKDSIVLTNLHGAKEVDTKGQL